MAVKPHAAWVWRQPNRLPSFGPMHPFLSRQSPGVFVGVLSRRGKDEGHGGPWRHPLISRFLNTESRRIGSHGIFRVSVFLAPPHDGEPPPRQLETGSWNLITGFQSMRCLPPDRFSSHDYHLLSNAYCTAKYYYVCTELSTGCLFRQRLFRRRCFFVDEPLLVDERFLCGQLSGCFNRAAALIATGIETACDSNPFFESSNTNWSISLPSSSVTGPTDIDSNLRPRISRRDRSRSSYTNG